MATTRERMARRPDREAVKGKKKATPKRRKIDPVETSRKARNVLSPPRGTRPAPALYLARP